MKFFVILSIIVLLNFGCAGGSMTIPLDNLLPLLLIQNSEQNRESKPIPHEKIVQKTSIEQHKCLTQSNNPLHPPAIINSRPQEVMIAKVDDE